MEMNRELPAWEKYGKVAFGFLLAALYASLGQILLGKTWLHPGSWMLAGIAVVALVLNLGLGFSRRCETFWVFQVLQAASVFAFQHFFFGWPWLACLPFVAGALSAGLLWQLCQGESFGAWQRLFAAGIPAACLVLALRWNGILGGLFLGVALVNGIFLARKLATSEASRTLVSQVVFGAALLVLGRAWLQFYLVQSGYAEWGIVMTHAYTFLALFGGMLLPLWWQALLRDRGINVAVGLLLFGVVLPVALGTVLHLRPLGAYLVGILVSSYAVNYFSAASMSSGILLALNFASACIFVALFESLSNLSRVTRIGVVVGLAVVVILALLPCFRRSPQVDAATLVP